MCILHLARRSGKDVGKGSGEDERISGEDATQLMPSVGRRANIAAVTSVGKDMQRGLSVFQSPGTCSASYPTTRIESSFRRLFLRIGAQSELGTDELSSGVGPIIRSHSYS